MPICTTCTYPTAYLYTIYQSAYNLRLEQCSQCKKFVDPYVEYDTLTILLDLILLKRGVYRHLLFNRGHGVRRAEDAVVANENDGPSKKRRALRDTSQKPTNDRWKLITQLGLGLVLTDAFIRWSHLHTIRTPDRKWLFGDLEPFLRIFIGCLTETLAFHAGVTLACAIGLRIVDMLRILSPARKSGVRHEFRLSHIPLTLLYSSLTKLFLLLLLSIWKPSTSNLRLSPEYGSAVNSNPDRTLLHSPLVLKALELFDEDKLDREWVVRNVLGGMAAGFGLRVVLGMHPIVTTIIVLFGWGVKTIVANVVHPWVGEKSGIGDVFLEYSIP